MGDKEQGLGAIPGSRASTEPASRLGPTGFDPERGALEMAHRDNALLREAGFELARAGARVVQDYDGLHRLSLAISGWFKAVAGQGDRGKRDWQPHPDYAGEPMREGEFRDPPDTAVQEESDGNG